MNHLASRALALVLLVSPLTDVFILDRRFPVAIYVSYVMAVLAIGLTMLAHRHLDRFFVLRRNIWYEALLMFLVAITTLSYLVGASLYNSTDYVIWFLAIFVVYGLFGKWLVECATETALPLLALEIAIFVSAILGLQDCAARAGLVFSNSWLADEDRRIAEIFGEFFGVPRLRSTASESALYACYLNMFVPLTLLRVRVSKVWFAAYGSVVALAYVLTYSLVAWACMIVAGLLGHLVVTVRNANRAAASSILAALVVVFFYVAATQFTGPLFSRIIDLDDVSWVERFAIYELAFDGILGGNLKTLLVGYGPGSFMGFYEWNPISWYLLLVHDLGVLSLFAVAMIFGGVLLSVRRGSLPPPQKWLLCVSVLSSMLHYSVIADFWHPWLWLTFPLVLRLARGRQQYSMSKSRPATAAGVIAHQVV